MSAKKSQTEKVTPIKKKPIKAGKPTKRAGTAVKAPNFTDLTETVSRGIEVYENVQSRMDKLIDRTTTVLAELRALAETKNITIPEIETLVQGSNTLIKLKQHSDRNLRDLKSEETSLQQKAVIFESLAKISGMVDKFEENLK